MNAPPPRPLSPACTFPARFRAPYAAIVFFGCLIVFLLTVSTSNAQVANHPPGLPQGIRAPLPQFEEWFGPARLTNTMLLFLLFTVLTLAPAIVIMTTSFVRIVIVLSITRQALGTQTLPPNTVLTTIALFMTLHIMHPVATQMYTSAVVPYTENQIDSNELVKRLVTPLRDFMAQQIENTGNQQDVWLFLDHQSQIDPAAIATYDDVPLTALLPAFLLSEVRTGFLIGFQLFLPFLVIDLAISSILVSMGMMMLPPVLISLPFKLLLFVLVDGWSLIADMLLTSFAPGAAAATLASPGP